MKRGLLFFCFFSLMVVFSMDIYSENDSPVKGKWDFKAKKIWETDSAGDNVLVGIQRVQIDRAGNCYAMSRKDTKIYVMDNGGAFRFAFGKNGEGPGEIKSMYDFWLLGDRVFVADMGKIVIFSSKGAFINDVKLQKMLIPVTFLDENRMLAVSFPSFTNDDQSRKVFIYDMKSGEETNLFQVPAPVVLKYAKGGTRLMLKLPEAAPDLAVALVNDGFLSGYGNQYKIVKLGSNGKVLFDFGLKNRIPEKISHAGKSLLVKKAIQSHQDVPKNVIRELADQIPADMPYFRSIHCLENGMIVVLVPQISQPGEIVVDIFSRKGEYLYQGLIQLDGFTDIISYGMGDDGLVIFAENPEGNQWLSMYHLDFPQTN